MMNSKVAGIAEKLMWCFDCGASGIAEDGIDDGCG